MEVITIALLYLVSSGLSANVNAEDDGFGNDLWRRKFKTYLLSFDHDNDGFLTYGEFQGAKDTFKNFFRGKNTDLTNNLNQLFDDSWRMMAGNAVGDTRLSYDQLTDGMQASGQATCQSVIGGINHIFFILIDINSDGKIESDEMQGLVTSFLLVETSDVDAAFKEMDINKDGYITEDEFDTHYKEYFCNGITHPGDTAFGPLVD